MNVKTIALDKGKARELFDRYKAVPKCRKTPEDEAIQSALRQVGHGKIVLDIVSAFKQTGLNSNGLPQLAICRADFLSVRITLTNEGSAMFHQHRHGYHLNRYDVRLPLGTFEVGHGTDSWNARVAASPFIPAYLRPEHALKNYHLLWEAVWTADPPRDPYLLRKLHGSLYVVLAEWDLTEIEMAAMRGRVRMG